jgi:hypothetical protein
VLGPLEATPVNLTNPPTAGGLTAADLIALLSIVVVIFGLLLTAIGVLVLNRFNALNDRITELKNDIQGDLRVVWGQIRPPEDRPR